MEKVFRVLLVCIVLLLTACTNIHLGEKSEDTLDEVYFGIVKVSTPQSNQQSKSLSLDVESYGAWFLLDGRALDDSLMSSGAGLGYKKTNRTKLSQNCQLIVMVYSQAELSKLLEILKRNGIDGDNVCALQRSP